MNEKTNLVNMNRRNFLKLLGAAGVTAAGVTLLDTAAPWLNDDLRVMSSIGPLPMDAGKAALEKDLVRYATLAANGHNTQPWKFALQDGAVQIFPDYSRRLAVVDPEDREMWISLGCALENLLIAARAAGYAAEVTYPDAAERIDVRLVEDTRQPGALFDAIVLRQNTRSEYDGRPVPTADFDLLQKMPVEPGVLLRFASSPADLETMLDYVNQGNLQQYADPAFVDELIQWLRFNKKEALKSLDGLFSICSGNPEVPRWLGKMFVSGTKPQQQADADAKKLRSSSGAVVIACETDTRTAWVRTGQVYERLSLQMTALNIKSALLNQPIEVPEVRPQFQQALGLGTAPAQLLMRYGYAEALPRSLRRPVEQVLI